MNTNYYQQQYQSLQRQAAAEGITWPTQTEPTMTNDTKQLWRNLRRVLWHAATAAVSAILTFLGLGGPQ